MDHTLAMILYASLQAGRRLTELRGDHSVTDAGQLPHYSGTPIISTGVDAL